MAINNRSSTMISNRDASPLILSNPSFSRSDLKEAYGYVSAVNADSAGSIYRMFQMPSNMRLSSIILQCEALGAGAKVDVGAYYGNDAKDIFLGNVLAGAVISANFFATAVDVSGALGPTDVSNESGSYTLDKQQMPLWQALGLASDPECHIDIAAVVNVAIAATGLLSLKGRYAE